MKFLSSVALKLGAHLPRGSWRVVRWAAQRDVALHNYPLPLRFLKGRTIQVDLREPVFMNFVRHGCIEHQIGEDYLCMAFLQPGDVVFDVGANIGYTTMLFASIVGPGGHVTAFEPSPRAFFHLFRNCDALSNVTCIQAGVSDATGEMRFYETASLDTSSLIPVDSVRDYNVPVVSLDEVAEGSALPTFVKIDVEGHEHAVFHGMKKLLSHPNPPVILFEAASADARSVSCELIQEFSQARYVFHGILRDGTVCGVNETEGMSNYLAWPAHRPYPDLFRTRI